MMATHRVLTREVLGRQFRIITAPEPITDSAGERCDYQLDFVDRVVWLDPALPGCRRAQVISDALSAALTEYLREVPWVE